MRDAFDILINKVRDKYSNDIYYRSSLSIDLACTVYKPSIPIRTRIRLFANAWLYTYAVFYSSSSLFFSKVLVD